MISLARSFFSRRGLPVRLMADVYLHQLLLRQHVLLTIAFVVSAADDVVLALFASIIIDRFKQIKQITVTLFKANVGIL